MIKAWVWGNEVDQSIDNGQIRESDRFQFLKLGLVRMDYATDNRKRLDDKLQTLPAISDITTVYGLIVLYLRKLYQPAIPQIQAMNRRISPQSAYDIADTE